MIGKHLHTEPGPQPSALGLKLMELDPSEKVWPQPCREGTVQQSQRGPNTLHMLADIHSVRRTTFLAIWPNFFL